MKLVPLDIKLTDSQFFELKKYTALQIAAAFGIKPNQINDYEKSSYASAEAQNLAFYVDTLLYILKQYEEEITYKILSNELIQQGYFFKFNVNVILRADIKTQMEALSKGVNNGIYTANEARSYLDLPAEEGGDVLMVNGNYIPITMIGQQYQKGGDS
jgi:HK97 family phage portal protein